jgi:hypothetical protein
LLNPDKDPGSETMTNAKRSLITEEDKEVLPHPVHLRAVHLQEILGNF